MLESVLRQQVGATLPVWPGRFYFIQVKVSLVGIHDSVPVVVLFFSSHLALRTYGYRSSPLPLHRPPLHPQL